MTALAGGLTISFVGEVGQRRFHGGWPELFGTLAALAAYALYVRVVERRPMEELAAKGFVAELTMGLAGGAALVGICFACLALVGAYHVDGLQGLNASLAAGFAEMMFVGVFEELLSRAIVFRLLERSLGTRIALTASALLFGLAHLPGGTSNLLSVAIAVLAGVLFAAAYLVTRRLWLCFGLHIGWNFTLGNVFSTVVSGHEQKPGVIGGHFAGPDWLTGGAYGLEASAVTFAVLLAATVWLLRRATTHGRSVTWRMASAARR